MLELITIAGVALAVILVIHSRPAGGKDSWLPAMLKGASVAYAEKTFRSARHRIVARLDRAYKAGTGHIHLVELKTRKRHTTYRSDVIELSAQRVALQAETGEGVSDDALVVTQVNGQRQGHHVKLLSEAEVANLKARRLAILAGQATPAYAHPAACRDCAYKKECGRPQETSTR